MFRSFLIIALLRIPVLSFSQTDTINRKDENGLKQGWWIFYGKDRPETGYPHEGKIEEGMYINNRKEGSWTKYHKDGKTVKLRGVYVNNRPNGTYSKYHDNGVIKESGTFYKNKYADTLRRFDRNGRITELWFDSLSSPEGRIGYIYDTSGNLKWIKTEIGEINAIVVKDCTKKRADGSNPCITPPSPQELKPKKIILSTIHYNMSGDYYGDLEIDSAGNYCYRKIHNSGGKSEIQEYAGTSETAVISRLDSTYLSFAFPHGGYIEYDNGDRVSHPTDIKLTMINSIDTFLIIGQTHAMTQPILDYIKLLLENLEKEENEVLAGSHTFTFSRYRRKE